METGVNDNILSLIDKTPGSLLLGIARLYTINIDTGEMYYLDLDELNL